MPLTKEQMREYMRKRRAEKSPDKLVLEKKEAIVETTVPRIKMETQEIPNDEDLGSMNCPACGGYEEHRSGCKGKPVVLLPRKCDACGRTWGSTTETPCPYCRGKGKVLHT